MTRLQLILSSLMFFLLSTAVAQEKLTKQKIDNIKALLDLANYKETVRVTWKNLFQQIIKVQQAAKPELKNPTYEKVLMDVGRILVEEMVNENSSYMASVIHTYHRHFTANEIRQMLEWQASPVGRKSARVTPMIVQELKELGELYWQSNQEGLSERLEKRFREELQ
jgi:hypothetical protein